jgi:LysM repeat protein
LTHSAAVPVPTDTTSYATYPVVFATDTPVPTITPTPDPTPTPTPAPVFRQHYKVKKGDTLAGIAGAYGLKTWEVLAANPILANNAGMLQVGMTLNIPKPGQMKKP